MGNFFLLPLWGFYSVISGCIGNFTAQQKQLFFVLMAKWKLLFPVQLCWQVRCNQGCHQGKKRICRIQPLVVFRGKRPTFLAKSKLSSCERKKRLNYGSFNVMVNALYKFKVRVESFNTSDHFHKIDTFTGRLRRFYMFQKLELKMWCIKHIHNANTLEFIYLFKNLSFDVCSRKPIIKWFVEYPSEKKWLEECRGISFVASLRIFN